ncbi:pimeloyl-ACP methyl ester carboxylesterase [Pseudoduganella flava]|uniref:Alpha/beta fold hydrolase n=1 Tax=Pseudoduganella flava TaxID=871742 RepID=A0A562Q329_9BURK|nr:alpha/beta fold hydrolase [Pseudoduganella flava]QGZ41162.1 alpha/beta fold hydrolase [Pseudoduganella flava]TWI51093.1 pimeloyl-ACP methyl ester carboxylesterase [Pseudoduganella flava]
MRFRFFIAVSLLLAARVAVAAPPGRSCHLPGAEEALRCVTVQVPLDYAHPGKSIAIHATVAAAYREAARPDPLFVLAGGPGQAGSDILPIVQAAFRRVRATRDIVLIDQRGTGLSGKLDCKTPPDIDTMTEEQADAYTLRCLKALDAPYVHYTTDAAARDIERVRQALGYRQINLWGGSYGTRLAQHYARLYPANVRALILDGVAAPDQVIAAGGADAQAALDATLRRCEQAPACARTFPALRTEFAALAAKLAQGPVTVTMADPRTAALRPVTISLRRFVATVHRSLYAQADAHTLPFLIHSAYNGRWEPFVAQSNRDTDFSTDGAMSGPLYLAVVCAEDYPKLSPQLAADDARGSFLGSALVTQLGTLCPVINAKPVNYTAAAPITAPVLLLSGAQDPVTPPRRAEAAARLMKAPRHLVVKNGGHIVSTLGCVPRLMREFLDQPGGKLAAACLDEIPAPTFQLDSAGPQP